MTTREKADAAPTSRRDSPGGLNDNHRQTLHRVPALGPAYFAASESFRHRLVTGLHRLALRLVKRRRRIHEERRTARTSPPDPVGRRRTCRQRWARDE